MPRGGKGSPPCHVDSGLIIVSGDTQHERVHESSDAGSASPVSVHSNTGPHGREAAGTRETEPRSGAGKVANKCGKLEGPNRRGRGE